MKMIKRGALAATAIFSVLSGLAVVTPAQAQFAQHTMIRIQSITPLCSEYPDFPVVGRVAAYYSTTPRSVRMAFVGCFPSFSECEAWRREAMRPLNPPIMQNRCEERW